MVCHAGGRRASDPSGPRDGASDGRTTVNRRAATVGIAAIFPRQTSSNWSQSALTAAPQIHRISVRDFIPNFGEIARAIRLLPKGKS